MIRSLLLRGPSPGFLSVADGRVPYVADGRSSSPGSGVFLTWQMGEFPQVLLVVTKNTVLVL